jgi:hypothetical protein
LPFAPQKAVEAFKVLLADIESIKARHRQD